MLIIDIIVCFCDKDYYLIDQFLGYIKRLTFDYQLTFIDNRKDKSVDLHKKLANYNYFIPEKDYGLFESRRYGFNHTNNDFVWFVDIDDEIFDFKLKNISSDDDVIIYNFNVYKVFEKKLDRLARVPYDRVYRIDLNDESMIQYVDTYLMRDGIWNKLFNRKTLKKCYESIPRLENFFVYEDIYLHKHFTYFASKYRTDTQYVYTWNMTQEYKIKDHLPDAEKFYTFIANPRIKKEYRKFLDLIYSEENMCDFNKAGKKDAQSLAEHPFTTDS